MIRGSCRGSPDRACSIVLVATKCALESSLKALRRGLEEGEEGPELRRLESSIWALRSEVDGFLLPIDCLRGNRGEEPEGDDEEGGTTEMERGQPGGEGALRLAPMGLATEGDIREGKDPWVTELALLPGIGHPVEA